MMGRGGGVRGPSNFFESEILAQSAFFGPMKDAGIFLGCKTTEGFFGDANKGLRDFLGMLKKVMIFFR